MGSVNAKLVSDKHFRFFGVVIKYNSFTLPPKTQANAMADNKPKITLVAGATLAFSVWQIIKSKTVIQFTNKAALSDTTLVVAAITQTAKNLPMQKN